MDGAISNRTRGVLLSRGGHEKHHWETVAGSHPAYDVVAAWAFCMCRNDAARILAQVDEVSSL